MIIVNILIGLILLALGTLMLKYNFQVTNMFSRNNFFERKLGMGSTYIVMQALAVLIVLYGALMIAGLHDNVSKWLLSPLTNLFQSGV